MILSGLFFRQTVNLYAGTKKTCSASTLIRREKTRMLMSTPTKQFSGCQNLTVRTDASLQSLVDGDHVRGTGGQSARISTPSDRSSTSLAERQT